MQQTNSENDSAVRDAVRRAFQGMDASDDVTSRVMASTFGRREAKGARVGRRVARRVAVACAALTLVSTGAYAAVLSDFFRTAFGPKGQEDVAAHEVTSVYVDPETGESSSTSWMAPARDWEAVDEDAADRILGAYVQDVGQSVTFGGYILTVGQYVMDANGNGVAAVSIENPDGLDIMDAGYGEVWLSNDTPVYMAMMSAGGGLGSWSWRTVGDKDASTATRLEGAVYFGPFSGNAEEGAAFVLRARGGETQESDAVELVPASTLPVSTLASEDGGTVELSPVAITVPAVSTDVTINYKDGGEYVVARGGDDPVSNAVESYIPGDGSAPEEESEAVMLFNRLVDVEQVKSVSVVARDGSETTYLAG